MARGERHDPETKAAVIAALMAGQGMDSVAKDFNLPEGTVKTWKREANERLRRLNSAPGVEPQKDEDPYGALVDIYLKESLTTLAAQQVYFRDPDWLKRQSAESVAVLHGVTADKALRILEAIERASNGEDLE